MKRRKGFGMGAVLIAVFAFTSITGAGVRSESIESESHALGVPADIDRLVRDAWRSIDRAAAAGDADGVVRFLDANADVRLQMPDAASAVRLDKLTLALFWRQSFESPGGFRVRRDGLAILPERDRRLRVDSTIDERLIDADGEATELRLTESARVRIDSGRVVIESLALRIARR